MTKKDFELIAQTIRELDADDIGGDGRKLFVAIYFAIKLSSTNPRFDRDRFIEACGCEVGP